MLLRPFNECLKQVSGAIKQIGGSGRVHGCIVDIDFENHVYIDPFNGSITPYFARSMTDKWAYKNIQSLLKNKCPELYLNYQKECLAGESNRAMVLFGKDVSVSDETTYDFPPKMYSVSKVILNLQYTTKNNVVRLWNDVIEDTIDENPSEENGRVFVQSLISADDLEEENADNTWS